METFFITSTYLLIGLLLRRIPRFPEATGQVLNAYVIHVALPAVVLLKIPELAFTPALAVTAIIPWAMLAFSCGAVFLLARLFRWDRPTTGCLLLLVPLGNTSFLGIPMVRAFFGEAALSFVVLYDQLGTFLALATYGSLILALYGGEGRITPRGVLLRIGTFPPFIALVLAFSLRGFDYPAVMTTLLRSLADTLVPVVMIAVGFQLRLRIHVAETGPFAVGLLLKLVAAPVAALLLCRLFGFEGEAARVSVFEAGMPPMISAGALAMMSGLAPRLAAALVGFGILISFATLPVLFRFL